MARIEPLPPKQFSAEYRAALAALRSPNIRQPIPQVENRPKGLNVLGTLAHHPELARAYFTLNAHVLQANTVTDRHRELLVMRVAAVRNCGYVWAQHLFIARDAGLTDEEVGRIAFGPDAPLWDALDAAILRAVDELVASGTVTEPTWLTLVEHFDTRQILDLVFTVGTFDLLARLLNALEMDLDPDILVLMQKYAELF